MYGRSCEETDWWHTGCPVSFLVPSPITTNCVPCMFGKNPVLLVQETLQSGLTKRNVPRRGRIFLFPKRTRCHTNEIRVRSERACIIRCSITTLTYLMKILSNMNTDNRRLCGCLRESLPRIAQTQRSFSINPSAMILRSLS